MVCSTSIMDYMHDYLDGDISEQDEELLKEHLLSCQSCQAHFQDLKKTIAFIQSPCHVQTSLEFTSKVMSALPKEKKQVGMKRWFQQHPMLTAASLFFILMAGSFLSNWNENRNLSVSKYPNIVIEKDTVIVPKGETVHGDIVVKNGDLKIEGEVEGDVTVINGDKYLASAGKVTGEIEEVNEIFDWIWYQIKKTTKDTIKIFSTEKNEQ